MAGRQSFLGISQEVCSSTGLTREQEVLCGGLRLPADSAVVAPEGLRPLVVPSLLERPGRAGTIALE